MTEGSQPSDNLANENGNKTSADMLLPDSDANVADKPGRKCELTPEEQMALYEKDLKENDWGHQPC